MKSGLSDIYLFIFYLIIIDSIFFVKNTKQKTQTYELDVAFVHLWANYKFVWSTLDAFAPAQRICSHFF